jgi:hypothetical protein
MNDPKWFKLLVRAIGLFILTLSIGRATDALRTSVLMITSAISGSSSNSRFAVLGVRDSWTGPEAISSYIYIAGGIAQVGFGLYLLFGAPKLVRYCVREVSNRCVGCDYDIRGLKGKCPECGLEIPEVAPGPQA